MPCESLNAEVLLDGVDEVFVYHADLEGLLPDHSVNGEGAVGHDHPIGAVVYLEDTACTQGPKGAGLHAKGHGIVDYSR